MKTARAEEVVITFLSMGGKGRYFRKKVAPGKYNFIVLFALQ